MIHVLYSFCRTLFSFRGRTLPWQLVDAHEPGPVYLPAPTEPTARVCEKVFDGERAHNRRAAASTGTSPKELVSAVLCMGFGQEYSTANFPEKDREVRLFDTIHHPRESTESAAAR